MQAQNRNFVIPKNKIAAMRWDYEVNNLSQNDIIRKYNYPATTVRSILNYKSWSNINIDKEVAEYLQSKTINGLTEQEIIAQGGLK